MIQISSPSNPNFRKAMRLHESRGRKQQDRIIVFGANEIRRAVASKIEIDQAWVAEQRNSETEALIESFEQSQVPIFEVEEELFSKLCFGQRIEDMVLVAKRPSTELNGCKFSSNSLVVVLESIEKPCLLYTSPSPRDRTRSRMPSSA